MAVTATGDFSGPFAPDGATTVFPFNFAALSADEVTVVRMSATGVQTPLTGYTVTLQPDRTGSVIFSVAPSAGDPIYIVSNPSFEQQTTFANQSSFSASVLGTELDRAAIRDIALAAAVSRAVLAPPTENLGVLPSASARAGRYLAFDSSGLATVASGTGADAGLRTDLASPVGSSLTGFVGSGTGASTRSVQAKLRDLPKHVADYDTFAHFATAATPFGFFSQNGADIQRAERLMLGGAMFNDCAYPNVNKDWLTQFQIGTGLVGGSIVSAQFASLNFGVSEETAAVGVLSGIESQHFNSAGTNALGVQSIVVNNHGSLSTYAWAFYGEAHKTTAASGSTYFIEGDTRTLVDSVSPTPFQQGDVIGFQMGSGAGVSATGQFDASAAFQVVANPKKFKVGINFLSGALTSGLAIHLAAQASNPHRLQWTNATGNAAGSITSTAVGASANKVTFTDNGLQVAGADGSAVAYFNTLSGGANWLSFGGAAAAAAPSVAAQGSDTNIDLLLSPKGSGSVRFGSFASNADAAVTGYVTIKDSGGTLRKLAVIA
jgi:hypothetical protein